MPSQRSYPKKVKHLAQFLFYGGRPKKPNNPKFCNVLFFSLFSLFFLSLSSCARTRDRKRRPCVGQRPLQVCCQHHWLGRLHEGSPNRPFFITLSCADLYWPDLLRLLPGGVPQSFAAKWRAILDNPHLVDRYFELRMKEFILHMLQEHLSASWYWFRRIRCHGLCRIRRGGPQSRRPRQRRSERPQ